MTSSSSGIMFLPGFFSLTWSEQHCVVRAWPLEAGKMGMVQGTLAGYRDSARFWRARAPVSLAAYQLHRALKKLGPCPLSEIESLLPPLKSNLPWKLQRPLIICKWAGE